MSDQAKPDDAAPSRPTELTDLPAPDDAGVRGGAQIEPCWKTPAGGYVPCIKPPPSFYTPCIRPGGESR